MPINCAAKEEIWRILFFLNLLRGMIITTLACPTRSERLEAAKRRDREVAEKEQRSSVWGGEGGAFSKRRHHHFRHVSCFPTNL